MVELWDHLNQLRFELLFGLVSLGQDLLQVSFMGDSSRREKVFCEEKLTPTYLFPMLACLLHTEKFF